MIRVYIHTNLDLHKESWPNQLPAVPRVGDYIRSNTRWSDGFQLELEVTSVTWTESIPLIQVHFKKNWQFSIAEFYNWYAPKVGRDPRAFY